MNDDLSNMKNTANQKVHGKVYDIKKMSEIEIQSIIHNLEVHKVELEMQNNELQAAQTDIQQARNKYFELFEFAPVGYLVLNESLIVQEVNTTYSELTGFSKHEIKNQLITTFIGPDYQDTFHIAKQALLKSSTKQSFEMKFRHKDKKEIWTHTEFIYKPDDKSFLLSCHNIEKQKQAEIDVIDANKTIQINEIKLKSVIDNFPNGSINLINREFKFEFVGGTDYQKFDIDTNKFINQAISDVLSPELYKPARQAVEKAFLGEIVIYEIEFGGAYYRNIASPVNINGDPVGFVILICINITDKVHAENQLKIAKKLAEENSQRFKFLSSLTFEGIFIHNNGIVIDANETLAEMLGFESAEKIIGTNIIIQSIAPDCQPMIKKLSEQGYEEAYEVIARKCNGMLFPVEMEAKNIVFQGVKMRMVAVRDITKRKQAEQALIESENRLRLALEGASDGVWDWNLETNDIYFSKNWKKMLGYEEHELENKFSVWEKLTHPEDVKKTLGKLNQYLSGNASYFHAEYKMKHKNGSWVDVLSRAVAVNEHPDGKPYRIVGTNVNISEQKQVSENLLKALHESEQKQVEVSELLNATYSILKTNDFEHAAKEIFNACKKTIGAKAGYVALLSEDGKDNELLFLDDGGLPCSVDPKLPMPVRGLRAEAYKTGKVVYDNNFMESKWARFMPKGHVYLPNVLFAPLKIGGEAVGVLGMSNKESDFTPNDARLAGAFAEYAAISLLNSKSIEKLEKRAKQLQKLNATKDKLLSIISHDIKNPIETIVQFTDIIRKKYDKYNHERRRQINDAIHESASAVSKLIHDLLLWSKSQGGGMKLKPKHIPLKEIIDECIDIINISAKQKDIHIENEINSELVGYFDKNSMMTVFRNILSNAMKFSHKGGKVHISGKKNEHTASVFIKDDGVGMDKEILARLYNIHEDFSTTGTSGEKGTGLGLIICKDFIVKNNGEIQVESYPGKGSTFIITLPT